MMWRNFLDFLGTMVTKPTMLALLCAFFMLSHTTALKAQEPPAATADSLDWLDEFPNEVETMALDFPHVNSSRVMSWASLHVPEIMSFKYNDIQNHAETIRPYFTERGWEHFQFYLQESGIVDSMSSRGYLMQSIVDQPPFKLNEAPVDGVYNWLIEIPLLVSFFREGDISNPERQADSTGYIKATIQVARTREVSDTNKSMAIHHWKVEARN